MVHLFVKKGKKMLTISCITYVFSEIKHQTLLSRRITCCTVQTVDMLYTSCDKTDFLYMYVTLDLVHKNTLEDGKGDKTQTDAGAVQTFERFGIFWLTVRTNACPPPPAIAMGSRRLIISEPGEDDKSRPADTNHISWKDDLQETPLASFVVSGNRRWPWTPVVCGLCYPDHRPQITEGTTPLMHTYFAHNGRRKKHTWMYVCLTTHRIVIADRSRDENNSLLWMGGKGKRWRRWRGRGSTHPVGRVALMSRSDVILALLFRAR